MIALCTIVKNEEKIIQRMLESVKGFVDAYYILDTGSTDKTVQIVEEWLKNHDGAVGVSTFKGFATSRNEALEMVSPEYDYILLVDADEVLEVKGDIGELSLDMYGIYIKQANDCVLGARIFKNSPKIKFEREIHNQIAGAETEGILPYDKIMVHHIHDGARAFDKDKLPNDIIKLNKSIKENKEPSSADLFYLAQTYYAMGNRQKAKEVWSDLVKSEGNTETCYQAHFMLGKMLYDAGFFDLAFFELMDAYSIRKTVEASYYMIKIARFYKRDKLAQRLFSTANPENLAVYIIPEIRDYLLDMEFADMLKSINEKEALKRYEILQKKQLPDNIRKEVEKNVVSLSESL